MASTRKLCECGCGQPTQLAKETDRRKGHVKGQPLRFRPYHHLYLRANSPTHYLADPETGCWIWQRSKRGTFGYGGIRVNNKNHYAHRWYYEQRHGPVPVGLELDHLCRNPACVNPDHLEPVTHAENNRRGANTKLTSTQAATIRRSPDGAEALADQYDVSTSAIYMVRRGATWLQERETPA